MLLRSVAKMSWCTMPNEARKTNFGRKFHARPTRGAKLFRSFFASGPGACTIAPCRPVIGSRAVGSNCDCCPYFVWNGDSYEYRTPRFSVSPRNGFQSSWKYAWCDHHRGSQLANADVYVALVTVPSRNEAIVFPVFGVNGAFVAPKLYVPPGSAAAVALYRVRISS